MYATPVLLLVQVAIVNHVASDVLTEETLQLVHKYSCNLSSTLHLTVEYEVCNLYFVDKDTLERHKCDPSYFVRPWIVNFVERLLKTKPALQTTNMRVTQAYLVACL